MICSAAQNCSLAPGSVWAGNPSEALSVLRYSKVTSKINKALVTPGANELLGNDRVNTVIIS